MNAPLLTTGRFAFTLFTLLEGLEKLPAGPTGDAKVDRGQVVAHGASTVRLDRLFDIFFESYWTRHAGLTEVALTGRLMGRAQIEIWRRDSLSGLEEAVVSIQMEGNGQAFAASVTLHLACDEEHASCLFAKLHLAEGSVLSELRWCAAVPPVRDVRLTGIICTFNREEMLAGNLAQFAAEVAFLHRLIVVNQGDPGIADRMTVLDKSSTPIMFVDQPNLGGAGGFTRGIVEGLDDPEATHFLLMDDDIDAQPALLARIVAVLAYAAERHCVGGAMLDIQEPGRLFTCGDQMHPTRPTIINIAPDKDDDDIATNAGRDFVARQHRVDFNGWWCFAFPVAAVRRCGLPLPLFIRGDDVEFGLRLTHAGFSTLPWPGIAVWHAPFYLKARAWQAFYDRRNMLFLNALHRLYPRRREVRSAWGSFRNALKVRDYARADAVIAGVQAFNGGVVQLEHWSGANHDALVKRAAQHHVRFGWVRVASLWLRAVSSLIRLRLQPRPDPRTVLRLTTTDFWRVYLPAKTANASSSCNKGFANCPDDGIAPSLSVKTKSVNSCDPNIPKS
ncbi:glycosyltransferase family 2 protein [Sphingobium vermicomposti]|uniref:GT2 family glycosyltransferase n=1 Tax=Sphingobium vermicomposti TaxID=529005 RepID=A0A846M085_9SPHN|nr:glycosyltransferase [Sphingobium vermicomposti]NIJ15459.1 GT2 family glycosyltransferase [Sphingobium vermicomposti]